MFFFFYVFSYIFMNKKRGGSSLIWFDLIWYESVFIDLILFDLARLILYRPHSIQPVSLWKLFPCLFPFFLLHLVLRPPQPLPSAPQPAHRAESRCRGTSASSGSQKNGRHSGSSQSIPRFRRKPRRAFCLRRIFSGSLFSSFAPPSATLRNQKSKGQCKKRENRKSRAKEKHQRDQNHGQQDPQHPPCNPGKEHHQEQKNEKSNHKFHHRFAPPSMYFCISLFCTRS